MTYALRRDALPLLGIVALYLLFTLPRAVAIVHYDPDVVENLDIIRHLAAGDGFVSTFRTYFFGPEGFPQPPQLIRPILYPLLVWPLYAAAPGLLGLQLLGFALGALNLLLLHGVLRPWVPRAVALGAPAVLAVMWIYGRNHVYALPEPLSLTFPLLALWVAAPPQSARRSAPLLLGLLLGLSFLAKPATLALLPVLLAYDLWCNPAHRRPLPLLAVAAGLLLCWLPLLRLNLLYGLSPFYASAGAQFTVFHPLEMMWDGFDRPPSPPAAEFVARYWRSIAASVVRNYRDNVALVISTGGLAYLLAIAGPAVLLWRRRGMPRVQAAFLALAVMNFLFYSSKWSPSEERRYLLVSVVFAVPPLLGALHGLLAEAGPRTLRGRVNAYGAALAVVVACYAFQTLYDVRETVGLWRRGVQLRGGANQDVEEDPDFRAAVAAARPHLASGDVVTASEPWIWGYLTAQPYVILPSDLSRADLERLLELYDVRLVALNFQHQPPDAANRAYPEWLAARRGVRHLRERSYDLFFLPRATDPPRR
ncbi:MAG: hypothetical protein ABR599_06395 [Gemmatimonadota bacterium]